MLLVLTVYTNIPMYKSVILGALFSRRDVYRRWAINRSVSQKKNRFCVLGKRHIFHPALAPTLLGVGHAASRILSESRVIGKNVTVKTDTCKKHHGNKQG